MKAYQTPQVNDPNVYRSKTEQEWFRKHLLRHDITNALLMMIAALLILLIMTSVSFAETITDCRGVEHQVAQVRTVNPQSVVNVRERANKSSAVQFTLKCYEDVAIYGEDGDWYLVTPCSFVRMGLGQKGAGYISKKYLKIKE